MIHSQIRHRNRTYLWTKSVCTIRFSNLFVHNVSPLLGIPNVGLVRLDRPFALQLDPPLIRSYLWDEKCVYHQRSEIYFLNVWPLLFNFWYTPNVCIVLVLFRSVCLFACTRLSVRLFACLCSMGSIFKIALNCLNAINITAKQNRFRIRSYCMKSSSPKKVLSYITTPLTTNTGVRYLQYAY